MLALISFRIQLPTVQLPRFISEGEIEEHYHAAQVHVSFRDDAFRFSLLTQSDSISRCERRFDRRSSMLSRNLIMRMSSILPTKLTSVEELRLVLNNGDANSQGE
jgi:hypothetical protein